MRPRSLTFHNVRERGVPRLIETQVSRQDSWEGELQCLQAAVDLAGDLQRLAALCDSHFGRKGSLRPIEQAREHLAGLVRVVCRAARPTNSIASISADQEFTLTIDGLLAQDEEVRLVPAGQKREDLSDGKRLQLLVRAQVRFDVDACAE